MDRPFPAYKGEEPYIFVCYAHEDSDVVYPELQRLHDGGVNIWYDEGIAPGHEWTQELADAIEGSSQLLNFVSPASVASRHCRSEVQYALEQDKALVSVYLEPTELPGGLKLSLVLAQAIMKYELSAEDYQRKISDALRIATQPRAGAPPPVSDDGSPRWPLATVAFVAVVLIVAAGLAVYFLKPWAPAPTVNSGVLVQSTTVDVSRPVEGFGGRGAVAVLPFINMSEDAGQGYFADGVTEDIITSLQTWGVFPVISRNSTFAYKGEAVDVPSMAAKLGVRYVLVGSVRTVGNRVRITAQLIDAESNANIWAKSFDRDMTHIFALQDEITEQIVTAIAPEITRKEMRRVSALRTADLEAYDLVLKALSQIQSVGDAGSARELIALLDRAIEIDPNYALAWARRAEAEHNLITGAWRELGVDRGSLEQSALDFARRAVQLDPNLVDARFWYGHMFLHAGRLEDGVKQLKAAVELNPSHAQAHAELGHGLALLLRLDEAIAELDIAARLSPNDPRNERILTFRANVYYLAEQYEEAALVARLAIEASQGQQAPATYGYWLEASSLVRLGRMDHARAVSEEYNNRFGATDLSAIQYGTWGPGQADQMIVDLIAANFGTGHSGRINAKK